MKEIFRSLSPLYCSSSFFQPVSFVLVGALELKRDEKRNNGDSFLIFAESGVQFTEMAVLWVDLLHTVQKRISPISIVGKCFALSKARLVIYDLLGQRPFFDLRILHFQFAVAELLSRIRQNILKTSIHAAAFWSMNEVIARIFRKRGNISMGALIVR